MDKLVELLEKEILPSLKDHITANSAMIAIIIAALGGVVLAYKAYVNCIERLRQHRIQDEDRSQKFKMEDHKLRMDMEKQKDKVKKRNLEAAEIVAQHQLDLAKANISIPDIDHLVDELKKML